MRRQNACQVRVPVLRSGYRGPSAFARIIARGLLIESALARIITGKYQYGMPLNRQATLLRRFGGDISSNTLAENMVCMGLTAQPVINLIRNMLLESNLIYDNETNFQVLKELGRSPQSKPYLWAQINSCGSPVRMFSYSPGRGAKHAQQLYAGVKSSVAFMTDAHELFNGIAHDQHLVRLGCWAPAQRASSRLTSLCPQPRARRICWQRASLC